MTSYSWEDQENDHAGEATVRRSSRTIRWRGWTINVPPRHEYGDIEVQTFDDFREEGAPSWVPDSIVAKVRDVIEELTRR